MMNEQGRYFAGAGCTCCARSQNECACGVDWTHPEIYELRKKVAELEKERDARDLETMALGIKSAIDFWHRETSNKMQGHIEYGILGKRPIDNPDSIPVEVLERDMKALIEQAKQLRAEVNDEQ